VNASARRDHDTPRGPVDAPVDAVDAPDALTEAHATRGNQYVQGLLGATTVTPGDAALLAALREAASDFYIDGDEWSRLAPMLARTKAKPGAVAEALLELSAFRDEPGVRNVAVCGDAQDGIRDFLRRAGYRIPQQGSHNIADLPYLRGSNRTLPAPTEVEVTKVLADVRRGGTLDDAGFAARVQPLLWRMPRTDGPQARELVRLYCDAQVAMSEATARELGRALRGCGYAIDAEAGRAAVLGQAEPLITAHVASSDATFEQVLKVARPTAARGGKPTLIGVLDGGLDASHPALRGKVAGNAGEIAGNGVDDDRNGVVDDVIGYHFYAGSADLDVAGKVMGGGGFTDHGTAVVGIATADTNQLQAVMVGVEPKDVGRCIDYAVARGARVINCSFALDKPEQAEAFRAAIARHPGVLFVQSAGNDDYDLDGERATPQMQAQHAPAANYLSIAAQADGQRSRKRDEEGRWFGSNWGAGHVDLAADATTFSSTSGEHYQAGAMTSQAAPVVSNVAGKCLVIAPELSAAQVRTIIRITARASAEWEGKTATGGVLDADAALRLAGLLHLLAGGATLAAAAPQLGIGADELPRYEAWVPLVQAS
jgi:subtilisin family serine protease